MKKKIYLTEVIEFLAEEIVSVFGSPESSYITNISAPDKTDINTLDWISPMRHNKQRLAENSKAKVIITDPEVKYTEVIRNQGKILLQVNNPKLSIARIGEAFFFKKITPEVHPLATIHPQAKLGENIFIGPNAVIGKCNIGDNVLILGNSYVYDNVTIKNNVEIHNGCSIGSEAHNFVRDNQEGMIRFPHLGGVIIEDNVIIGANTVISRGVLQDTIIKRGTKIAQLVFIGANNIIEENCAIRPNVMTSGSVKVGRNSIIAPSVTVREHCSIGENCMLGMGAVVTKNVPAGETWIGNPAKKLI